MSTPLYILSFVKVTHRADATLKPIGVFYGYVTEIGREWVTVQFHDGIRPTSIPFEVDEVAAIDEKTFWSKTKGQTALHSNYEDAKEDADEEREARDLDDGTTHARIEARRWGLSVNAGAAFKIADEIANLVDGLTHRDMPDSVASLRLKGLSRRYKAARLKHVAEG